LAITFEPEMLES